MDLMCSRCKERMAVIYVSSVEDGKPVNKGYCIKCAKELGIPQVQQMIDSLGISEEDFENLSDQVMGMFGENGDFSPGGAASMPQFMQYLKDKMGDEGLEEAGANLMEMLGAKKDEDEDDDISENIPLGEKSAPSSSKKEKKKKRKHLDSFCENLTEKARNGKLDNIVGRDDEIYRVMQILNRRQKNNPCLIGEAGVGKTAIAEGIAQKMAKGEIPPSLYGKELYLLDLTSLVAGTQFRGQFESRVKGLIEEIKDAGNIILFIDEVHSLIGAGDAEGSMNAANILKPALSRGEIQVIGATTFDEYRKYIEKDSALERRFQPVKVEEPSIEDSVKVIEGIKKYYENYHRVKVTDDIARRCVTMSERYINDRFLPDKAIDLLDEACSCCNLENKELVQYENKNRALKSLEDEQADLETQKEVDFARLAEIKSEIIKLTADIKELEPKALQREVSVDHLAKVVELWTGIPATKIKESEISKVSALEETLKKHIIGQDEAIKLVSDAVRRTRIQLSNKKRPASFIFVGPTGVGKTELVRRLANELFSTADPLIRLDMSEYMEKHTASKIVGSPPGYVGYDEAGQLTEQVRRRPYSVVLFDEIEKAHPDVMNILLQILDEGRITDSHGRVVSFENTVIVMTSNAGSNIRGGAMGFDKTVKDIAKERAMNALSEFLRPEFMARVDEIVVFNPLGLEEFKKISRLMLDELKEPLSERGIKFGYTDALADLMAEKAVGHGSGARDVRHTIRREVEDRLTRLLVENYEQKLSLISADVKDGEIVLATV